MASRVVGYAYLLDLLYDTRPGATLRDHLRRLDSIPAAMPSDQALVLLQRSGQQMALVTGPRRGLLGIVTVAELVEEIIGPAAGGR